MLGKYFSSIFTHKDAELVPDIDLPWHGFLNDVDVSLQKVEGKLASLKSTSSPGPDAIHSRILLKSAQAQALSSPLSTLFCKSLDTKMLPLEFGMEVR